MPKAADFSAIYGIRHIASGRIYVGSAVRTNARWRQHRSQLQRGTHHSRYLQARGTLPAQRWGQTEHERNVERVEVKASPQAPMAGIRRSTQRDTSERRGPSITGVAQRGF